MPIALNDLLRATSRSFYLTLRVLPAAVRPQISLAPRPVPKAQPDISQPQGGWSGWMRKFVLKGRWKHLNND